MNEEIKDSFSKKQTFIPTLMQGSSSGEERFKPDYDKYCTDNMELIKTLLKENISERNIRDGFSPQYPFYIVAGRFSHLDGFIDSVFKTMDNHIGSPSAPSKKDLSNLRRGVALSLFCILRMHHAIKYIIDIDSGLKDILNRGDINGGFLENSVIPSLRIVSPVKIKQIRSNLQVSEKDIIAYMKENSYEGTNNVISYLESGISVGNGGRIKHYRITTPLAEQLHKAFAFYATRNSKIELPDMDVLFPADPRQGPNNGLLTQVLPYSNGNHIEN